MRPLAGWLRRWRLRRRPAPPPASPWTWSADGRIGVCGLTPADLVPPEERRPPRWLDRRTSQPRGQS